MNSAKLAKFIRFLQEGEDEEEEEDAVAELGLVSLFQLMEG